MSTFLVRKAFIFSIVAVMLFMLPGSTFAQIVKVEILGTENAMNQLELLEQQRKQEELYFQMGLGLSEELRDGYIGLAAQYKNIPDVVAWSEYRIAEYDYSRDEFEEAIRKLLDIVRKYPNSDIGVEAQILAAEIADSPYNPNRDSARAAQILMLTKGRSLSSNPNERIQMASVVQQSGVKMDKNRFKQYKAMTNELDAKVTGKKFRKLKNNKRPIEKAISQNYNKTLVKANRDLSLSIASAGGYKEAVSQLKTTLQQYTEANQEENMDYFTFMTDSQDLEYQRALGMVAGQNQVEGIQELEAFIRKHPNSHLAVRAQQKLDELRPKPVEKTIEKSDQVSKIQPNVLSTEKGCICGPASLKMALSKLGIEAPLDILIKDAGTTDEGTTMEGLRLSASAQGVNAFGINMVKSELKNTSLPAVVLLSDHYVTVTSLTDDEVNYYDPLFGSISKSKQDFEQLWTGNAIVFADTEAEVMNGISGVRLLSDTEMKQLKGKYLCGNTGGSPGGPGCNDPCANFEMPAPAADGYMDGHLSSVNRIYGNHNLRTPELLLRGSENSLISYKFSYNSQANTRNSDVGMGWSSSYSDQLVKNGGNIQWLTSDGSRMTFSRNIDGTFTSPPGNFDKLTEKGDGSYILYRKNKINMSFNAEGRLVEQKDLNGQGMVFNYDNQGRQTQIVDSNGTIVNLYYNPAGKVSKVSIGNEEQFQLEYDSSEHLTKIKYADGKTIQYGYQGNRMSTLTDSFGKTTKFEYNSYGQITGKVNAAGSRMSYDKEFTNYSGAKQSFAQDSLRRITEVRDPLGNVTRFSYTPDNQVDTMTDPLGNQTKYYYDTQGNRASVVDALGNKTHYSYNEHGQVTAIIDALGRRTSYSYDVAGNLLTVTNPLGDHMIYDYDAKGNITKMTDFSGVTTKYEYNSSGLLTAVTNALGDQVTYEYDLYGRKTAETDPLGNTTNYSYDRYGHVTEITYADGSKETMQYDGERLTAKADRRGNITHYNYDDLGHLLKVTDPEGGTTEYGYDMQGRQISVKNANGQVTTKAYDAKDRVISVMYPGGLSEAFSYDAVDRVISKKNTDGTTVKYTYDAVGRIIKMERK